jgi:hypothetical protein
MASVSDIGSGLGPHLAGPLRYHHSKRDDRPSDESEQGRSNQRFSHRAILFMRASYARRRRNRNPDCTRGEAPRQGFLYPLAI